MATYGEPGKNPYTVKGVSGVLSNVVNADTGVTQVYRRGALNTYQSLGTYNPQTKKFTPATNLTDAEKRSFSTQESINSIKTAAETTAKKSQIEAGVTSQSADTRSKELLNTGKATSPPQTGDGTNPPDIRDLEAATAIDTSKTRVQFPTDLIYPEDLRQTKQDIIKFDMLQYKPRGFSVSQGLAGVGNREESKRNTIGTVILPIPSGISDQNSVSWGSENLNPAEAVLANTALTTITQGFGAGGKVIEGAAQQIQEGSDEVKVAVAAAFATAATGVGKQLLTRTTGAVINENMELLFQGPALRPFSFTFKMSARNKKEAKQIISIIRFFKQGMAAQRSASNLFLKSPHTFRIKYINRSLSDSKENPYIGKIKECALQSFNVNYTPEGQYATFYDGVLVSYEIQMSFTELEPIFNEDYGLGTGSNGPDTEIGY